MTASIHPCCKLLAHMPLPVPVAGMALCSQPCLIYTLTLTHQHKLLSLERLIPFSMPSLTDAIMRSGRHDSTSEPLNNDGSPATFSPEHNSWLETTLSWPPGTVLAVYQASKGLVDEAGAAVEAARITNFPAYSPSVRRQSTRRRTSAEIPSLQRQDAFLGHETTQAADEWERRLLEITGISLLSDVAESVVGKATTSPLPQQSPLYQRSIAHSDAEAEGHQHSRRGVRHPSQTTRPYTGVRARGLSR